MEVIVSNNGNKTKLNIKVDNCIKAYAKTDLFQNTNTGLGTNKDPSVYTLFFKGHVLTANECEALYRFNWAAKKVIEIPAEDATSKGITFETDNKDTDAALKNRFEELDINGYIEKAIILARLYGGALLIPGIDDGDQDISTPLDEDKIQSIDYMILLDRYQVNIDDTKRYNNIMNPKYGQPELYTLQPIIQVSGPDMSIRRDIHESRIIRFDGSFLPDRIKVQNQYWSDSVLMDTYEAIKNFSKTEQSSSQLIEDFVTKVLKMPTLESLLGTDDGKATIELRIQYAIAQLSSLGMVLIGEDETFDKIQTPITGLVDLIDKFMEFLSSAARIPKSRFFDQPLGKLAGATETTIAYYERIEAYREKKIRVPFETLTRWMLKSKNFITKGKEPEKWGFKFNPLWQEKPNEIIKSKNLQAKTDEIYVNSGVLHREEVRKSRFSDSGYDTETKIDKKYDEELEKLFKIPAILQKNKNLEK